MLRGSLVTLFFVLLVSSSFACIRKKPQTINHSKLPPIEPCNTTFLAVEDMNWNLMILAEKAFLGIEFSDEKYTHIWKAEDIYTKWTSDCKRVSPDDVVFMCDVVGHNLNMSHTLFLTTYAMRYIRRASLTIGELKFTTIVYLEEMSKLKVLSTTSVFLKNTTQRFGYQMPEKKLLSITKNTFKSLFSRISCSWNSTS